MSCHCLVKEEDLTLSVQEEDLLLVQEEVHTEADDLFLIQEEDLPLVQECRKKIFFPSREDPLLAEAEVLFLLYRKKIVFL